MVIEQKQAKFSKLIKLWEEKSIFSPSTLNKMRSAEDSWKAYTQQLKLDYADVISRATQEAVQTYDNYAAQVGLPMMIAQVCSTAFYPFIVSKVYKVIFIFIKAPGICVSCSVFDWHHRPTNKRNGEAN